MNPASKMVRYMDILRERKKNSRVYNSFQATGLTLAEILEDSAHKSLYIKLAKTHSEQMLFGLAKDVVSRKTIQNKGAYFMKVLQAELKERKKKK